MDFLGEVVSEVIGGHNRSNEAPSDPPYVQPPWVARWDGEAGSWIFVNEATGERTWDKPVIEEAVADWDRGEANMERRFDDGVQHVEDIPEDAARWTGEAVGSVEAVPDRIEHGFDRAEDNVEQGFEDAGRTVEHGWDETVDAVEDAPENMAEAVGEGVGKVEGFGDSIENFGDRMESSYDQGRDEERYD